MEVGPDEIANQVRFQWHGEIEIATILKLAIAMKSLGREMNIQPWICNLNFCSIINENRVALQFSLYKYLICRIKFWTWAKISGV